MSSLQEKDKKNLEARLKQVDFSSDRYELKEIIGGGCWGVVCRGYDNELEKEIAIKLIAPDETGKKQMEERNIDLEKAAKKEAEQIELAACANIVPRKFELDDNKNPFIVMPLYNRFFSDIIDDEMGIPWIIKYARDIAQGIKEVHELGRAHCDLKPDNLAYDEKKDRVLITDFGTATYATFGRTESPRDNLGFLYTRAPELFKKNSHPSKSSDVYAFGNLLYKMFTGEYVFQKEIDELIGKNGIEDINDTMDEFFEHNDYHDIAAERIEKSDIPDEFKNLIMNCINENYYNGDRLLDSLEKSIGEYEKNRIKKDISKEFRAELFRKFKRASLTAVGVATFVTLFAWMIYFAPRPDYSQKTDFMAHAQEKGIDESNILFLREKEYDVPEPDKKRDYEELLYYHRDIRGGNSLADKIVDIWIKTAEERGYMLNKGDNIHVRHVNLFREEHLAGSYPYHSDMIKDLLGYAMKINAVGNKVDLEDTLAVALLGVQKVREAQKAANSCDFDKYVNAKINGEYVIPAEEQNFLKALANKVSQQIPQKVRLEQDLYQSE